MLFVIGTKVNKYIQYKKGIKYLYSLKNKVNLPIEFNI